MSGGEERFLKLKLYLYNTNRKIKWESIISTDDDSGPYSLLEAFIDTLKECDTMEYYHLTSVTTAGGEAAPGLAPCSFTYVKTNICVTVTSKLIPIS